MRFHEGEIAVQERAGVRDAAEDVGEGIHDRIGAAANVFLHKRRMAVLGTIDSDGRMWASVVTGEPGFIEGIDEHTITIAARPSGADPVFDNLRAESHIAMFAPDFVTPRRLRVNGRGVIRDGRITITTEEVYGNCRRYIQERLFAGVRQLPQAGQIEVARSSRLSPRQQQQISAADTFFIATDHPGRGADVSHKGGKPGFVGIIDERRIVFPDYNGNAMFNTLGNLTVNPRAGLLFIDFDSGRTLQLTGFASIDWDSRRAQSIAGAERVVDFDLAEVIDNPCGFPLIGKFRQYSRYNP